MRIILALCLILSPAALAALPARAQDDHAHMSVNAEAKPAAMRHLRWSDPAAWPDGRVPREGDAVTIGRDMDVVLDVDPPAPVPYWSAAETPDYGETLFPE